MAKNVAAPVTAAQATPETRMTVKQIIAYAAAQGTTVDNIKLRNAFRNNPIFKADNAVIDFEIEGTDYPPVRKALQSAVDAWLAEINAPAAAKGIARTRGTTKYVLKLTAEQLPVVTEFMQAHGIDMIKAFVKKVDQPVIDSVAPVGTEAAPTEATQAVLPSIDALFESTAETDNEPVTA